MQDNIFQKKKIIFTGSLLLSGLLGIMLPLWLDTDSNDITGVVLREGNLELTKLDTDSGDITAFLVFILKFTGVVGLISVSYYTIIHFNCFGFKRIKIISVFIGIISSILFILGDMNLTLFEPIKEFSIDARFRVSTSQLLPTDVSQGIVRHHENPKAHKAIQIIGIDNLTVSQYQGFPFSWQYYAELIQTLSGSKFKTLMFDIFFLDQIKDAFAPHKKQEGKLSTYIGKSNKIIADYPFYTQDHNLSPGQLKIFQERLNYLENNEILNVHPSEYDDYPEWVKFPEFPIPDISKNLQGIGYANIRKQDMGINRTIPLVAKWNHKIYPSIVLVMAAHYYGLDIQQDVEVKLGSYVKLKNIPMTRVEAYDRDENGRILISTDGSLKTKKVDIMTRVNPERMIIIPIDKEGFMNINFIGGAGSYPFIPFHTIANSEPSSFSGDYDTFKNKILLVGIYYATGVAKDIHASPFGEIAGVEHHAHALNTILNQDFLTYVPNWVNYLIYLLIGVILGLIIPNYKITRALIGIILFSLLFALESFLVFSILNLIHVFLLPYIQISVTMIIIVGYKARHEEANVKYIKSTFSKFVAKDIVDELLNRPEALKLGGEKKEITIFFSDIRGFTSISESIPPEELISLLNEYLSEMTEVCLNYRGTIDKYIGDAIMAFWGAPLPEKDHAYLACLASLTQMKALEKLKIKWEKEGKPALDIGIGLNSGHAIVGNIGSSHRMDYTVIGDPVNLSSRLEGANKTYKTNIIISENTYLKVKDRVIVKELDTIQVKGKSEYVRIYELIDIKNQRDFEHFR